MELEAIYKSEEEQRLTGESEDFFNRYVSKLLASGDVRAWCRPVIPAPSLRHSGPPPPSFRLPKRWLYPGVRFAGIHRGHWLQGGMGKGGNDG